MNSELIQQKSWRQRNWKWLVGFTFVTLIALVIFFSSGMNRIASDLAQAYIDTTLYENAHQKAAANEKVIALLGELKPIDQLAILEGEVKFSDNGKTVNTTIRIMGSKGKARMDISAYQLNDEWHYTKINVRIKNPPENKQIIVILNTE